MCVHILVTFNLIFLLHFINCIYITDWPLEYIIYFATFPSALTGADLAIFAGCFAYLADVTTVKNRTLRIGILDAVYLSTMPTGVALGMHNISSNVHYLSHKESILSLNNKYYMHVFYLTIIVYNHYIIINQILCKHPRTQNLSIHFDYK